MADFPRRRSIELCSSPEAPSGKDHGEALPPMGQTPSGEARRRSRPGVRPRLESGQSPRFRPLLLGRISPMPGVTPRRDWRGPVLPFVIGCLIVPSPWQRANPIVHRAAAGYSSFLNGANPILRFSADRAAVRLGYGSSSSSSAAGVAGKSNAGRGGT
jgi:hypothetical protein